MSKNIIRIRFLSLDDAVQESVTNVILYLKKLTKAPTSDGKTPLGFPNQFCWNSLTRLNCWDERINSILFVSFCSVEARLELEEKNRNSAVVLSWNEPYDLSLEDEFFQVLFLEPNDQPKVLTDIVFYQHYLLDLLTCSVENDDQEQEVFCSVRDHDPNRAHSSFVWSRHPWMINAY